MNKLSIQEARKRKGINQKKQKKELIIVKNKMVNHETKNNTEKRTDE